MIDTITDEQALANNFIYKYKNRDGSEDLIVSTPVKFGKPDEIAHRNAPLIGEHTAEVMKSLGYTDADIKAWAADGAIGVHK